MSEPVTLIELDFGDADFVVRQHPDGMVTIETPEQLVLSFDQFNQVVKAFAALAQLGGP